MPYQVPNPPRVSIYEILQLFIDYENNNEAISAKFLQNHFKIGLDDAIHRLGVLSKWKVIKNITQGRSKLYIVTPWGKKYMADRKAKLAEELATKEKETKE